MDYYEHSVIVNGNEVRFGFSPEDNQIGLFGGSFMVKFPKPMTLAEVEADIIENYDKYKAEDMEFFYRANGFYD